MASEALALHPLVSFLLDPAATSTKLDARSWGLLLRAARRSNLLSRAACVAEDAGLEAGLPEKIRFHFSSAARVAQSSRQSTLREVRHIQQALQPAGIPCLLLKGAAYIVSGLAMSRGRLLSDIDIMVPRERLVEAERVLIQSGWMTTKLDAYDQRYYRNWMHELPPMQHLSRGTSLDVHHTILPPTALLKPDVALLWSGARQLPEHPGMHVLSPTDLILHSATHLFHEGEFPNGLRDLIDIDGLIREFSCGEGFWNALLSRARALDLERPLYYALRYCLDVLGTPIPEAVTGLSQVSAPPALLRRLMDGIVLRSIGSVLEDVPQRDTGVSLFAMYVRSHYLRMPLHQLLPHLLRKQFMRQQGC